MTAHCASPARVAAPRRHDLVATAADLRTAQTLLRHANLQTTAMYIQVADGRRVEAIDRLDPFGPRLGYREVQGFSDGTDSACHGSPVPSRAYTSPIRRENHPSPTASRALSIGLLCNHPVNRCATYPERRGDGAGRLAAGVHPACQF
jgi:hypothetical protein